MLAWLLVLSLLARQPWWWQLMSVVSLSFLQDTISQQTFCASGSYNLSTRLLPWSLNLRCRSCVLDISAQNEHHHFSICQGNLDMVPCCKEQIKFTETVHVSSSGKATVGLSLNSFLPSNPLLPFQGYNRTWLFLAFFFLSDWWPVPGS